MVRTFQFRGAAGGGAHLDEEVDLLVGELVEAAGDDRFELGALVFGDGLRQREEFGGPGVAGGDGGAVAVGVGGGLGGGQSPGTGVHGVVEEVEHLLHLLGRGLSADGVRAHDVAAQRAVSDHEPGVDGDPSFEGVEVLAEGGPAPVDAFLKGLEGHAFDLAHHAAGVVGVLGAAGVQRGQGEPASSRRRRW